MTVEHLLTYYEQELTFLRHMLADFAADYPDKAGRLSLAKDKRDKCDDPHVERLIESVAVLTARTRLKLDESYPAISDTLLGILHPQLMAPVPPMTVAQLELSSTQDDATEPYVIPRGTYLDSVYGQDVACRFRTAYDLDLWPLKVVDVSVVPVSRQELARLGEVDAVAAIRIRLQTLAGQPFSEMDIRSLRFYLDGKDLAYTLLEELLCDPRGLILRWGDGGPGMLLDPSHVRPVGFARNEALLEYPRGSFQGYRLIQEFFCFPEKFLFVEFTGLDRGRQDASTDTLELLVPVGHPLPNLKDRLTAHHFKLGCVPATNLFEQSADPVRLDQKTVQHHVVPDGRNLGAYEVHTILEVESTSPGSTEARPYKPFYALRSGDTNADETAFWHAERLPSMRKGDAGSDMFLTLVDPKGMPCALANSGLLHIKTQCLNRDLASRLPYKDPGGDLRAEGKPEVGKVICLEKPTPTLRPSLHGESRWKVVSSLALNHLSLTGTPERPEAGIEAFKEILGAHDFVNDEVTRQRLDGLVSMATRTVTRRLPGRGLARGLEITLEFDESKYVGSGVYLFASVLERFLAAYTSINSFTQCIARVRQREGDLKRWLPQSGQQAQV